MRTTSFLRMTNLARVGLVLSAILISLAAGISALIFGTPLAPLVVAGAILAVAFAVVTLHNPAWALYATIFVALFLVQVLGSLPTIPFVSQYPIVLGLLAASILWLLSVAVHRRKIVWTSANLLMLAFLAWSAITLFWAPNFVAGRQQLMAYIVGFVLLLLVVNEIHSRQTLDGLMAILALSGWFMVLAGVGTILTEGYTPGARLQVLGMNENGFGIVLLVTSSGILWPMIKPESYRKTPGALMVAGFLLLAMGLIAMSGSRGSIISLVITLLAFMLWKPTRPWGTLGLLVLMLGAVLSPSLFSTILERFAVLDGDTILGGREALWQAFAKFILDHPWGGAGVGNAPYEVMPYLRPLRSTMGYDRAPSHNPVLAIWAESGTPGILVYLGVLGSALWSFARQYGQRRRSGAHFLTPYFALVSSVFLGFMASWIKGGGMECDFTYFLMLALLLIPAGLDLEDQDETSSSFERRYHA